MLIYSTLREQKFPNRKKSIQIKFACDYATHAANQLFFIFSPFEILATTTQIDIITLSLLVFFLLLRLFSFKSPLAQLWWIKYDLLCADIVNPRLHRMSRINQSINLSRQRTLNGYRNNHLEMLRFINWPQVMLFMMWRVAFHCLII